MNTKTEKKLDTKVFRIGSFGLAKTDVSNFCALRYDPKEGLGEKMKLVFWGIVFRKYAFGFMKEVEK